MARPGGMPDNRGALEDARRRLIAQLQLAFSGELGAGHAYRGHWRSLRDPDERTRVRQIEDEEWHHRTLVGDMLRDLGARPRPLREAVFWIIGKTLGALCHMGGWFAPMYGAGRLERRNIKEYEDAAVYAKACGRGDLIDCLLTMAEVEWDHEQYFRAKAAAHPLARWVPLWPAPPPRESIRAAFAERDGAGAGRPVEPALAAVPME
jgi:demethoxyubiquinone hydroxylase (CLK1/Coq7/Cat5 family)